MIWCDQDLSAMAEVNDLIVSGFSYLGGLALLHKQAFTPVGVRLVFLTLHDSALQK